MAEPQFVRPAAEIARDLERFDTGLVSDALERIHGAGVLVGLRSLFQSARRIAGRALTLELGPAGEELVPPRDNVSTAHIGARAIDSARAGDVIVVANQGRVDAACWGELLALGAAVKGVRAVVIDGACRDVDAVRALGVEVFCRGVNPLTARGRWVERSSGEPVRISGVRVVQGDWVVGDATGVVVVPARRVEAVITAARHIATREDELRRALQEHRPVSEVLDSNYESLVE